MKVIEHMLSTRVNYLVLLAYMAFLTINLIYFFYFTVNWEYILFESENSNYYFGYVLNGDSYKAYFPDLESLMNGELEHFRPTHAISYIFYILWMIVPYEIDDVIYVAFIVNNFAIIISYVFFSKIGREVLGLDMRYRWLYFLNPILVYSSQMISKEALLLFAIPVICYYSLTPKFWMPLMATLILAFVRYPFLLLWPSMRLILGLRENRVKIKLLLVLIGIFLFMAGIYYSFIPFESYTELHDAGITRLAFQYNDYFLGPLIFAPFKLVGSFWDLLFTALFSSFIGGKVIIYHAVTLPIVFCLMLRVREIIYILAHPLKILRSQYGGVFAFIVIYLTIVAGNLFIHSRYLWPILPVLLLFLYSIKRHYISCKPSILNQW